MKRNSNAEKEVKQTQLPSLVKKFTRKISSISFSIENLAEIEKIPDFLKGIGISEWEHEAFYCGRKGGKKRALTLHFELRGRFKAKVLAWIKESSKAANWCLWEKWGDPLIYWNSKNSKLYRYYWIEK